MVTVSVWSHPMIHATWNWPCSQYLNFVTATPPSKIVMAWRWPHNHICAFMPGTRLFLGEYQFPQRSTLCRGAGRREALCFHNLVAINIAVYYLIIGQSLSVGMGRKSSTTSNLVWSQKSDNYLSIKDLLITHIKADNVLWRRMFVSLKNSRLNYKANTFFKQVLSTFTQPCHVLVWW